MRTRSWLGGVKIESVLENSMIVYFEKVLSGIKALSAKIRNSF